MLSLDLGLNTAPKFIHSYVVSSAMALMRDFLQRSSNSRCRLWPVATIWLEMNCLSS